MKKQKPNYSSNKIRTFFIILLVSQFYLGPLVGSIVGKDPTKTREYLYLYTIVAYLVIVLGIVVFQIKELETLQDHFSLWTIVVACFIAASPWKTNMVYRVLLVLLGLGLAVYISINIKNVTRPNFRSVFWGLLWSAFTVIVTALILSYLNPTLQSLGLNPRSYLINTTEFNLAFVTVIEEAGFRGLLFCLLVKNGYEENKALLAQAILFWGMHYLQFNNISLFFVAIPLLTLSTTLIIKKYKMLFLSIMVHTTFNVFLPVLLILFQQYKL